MFQEETWEDSDTLHKSPTVIMVLLYVYILGLAACMSECPGSVRPTEYHCSTADKICDRFLKNATGYVDCYVFFPPNRPHQCRS